MVYLLGQTKDRFQTNERKFSGRSKPELFGKVKGEFWGLLLGKGEGCVPGSLAGEGEGYTPGSLVGLRLGGAVSVCGGFGVLSVVSFWCVGVSGVVAVGGGVV